MSKVSRNRLIELGFKPVPESHILDSLIFDIGRRRFLAISQVGTCNEMMFIEEIEFSGEDKIITDLVPIHNYDYDGFLTEKRVKAFIRLLKKGGR